MFLGIEIGGTKLQVGVGDGRGRLAGLWRGDVVPAEGSDGIRRRIGDGVAAALDAGGVPRDAIRGVGVGFGGPVDDRDASVVKSHQIAGWDRFPLARWVGDLLGLPASLGNDADVAGLAEARFGAGRGCDPVFYVTVGSGVGGGLILGGRIHRGTGRGAAEIGHLRMPPPDDPLGPWAPLETFASGWAIQTWAQTAMTREPARASGLREAQGDSPTLTTCHVAEAARRGDAQALAALGRAHEALAVGLAQVVAVVCPQRIVLGGGVSLIEESLWLGPIRKRLREIAFGPFADEWSLASAELGEAVVVQGALALARENAETQAGRGG